MTPEGKAAGIGVATLAIGVGLVAFPDRSARLAGLDGHRGGARVIGVADLALVPGLLWGRPRWPWVLARMGLNLAIGGYAAGVARRDRRPVALASTAAMLAVTAADSTIARPLLEARR